jgi:hypothetical protein
MVDDPAFWLIVLALLVTYLCVSGERRLRAENARFEDDRLQARERLSPGAATNFSAIAPQIQRLRQDHLAAVPFRPHDAFHRRGLIAAFLQVVTNRSYFHHLRSEHDRQKHDIEA